MPTLSPEYRALTETVALLDLCDRGRLCLVGADRDNFLHGQVTNEIARLRVGQGAYAALVTAKGRIETDLFVHKLADELLLDFEPGLADKVTARLEKYIIAEDVQIVDVSSAYGLLSLQGPHSESLLVNASLVPAIPKEPLSFASAALPEGDLYAIRNHRFGPPAFDLFIPAEAFVRIASQLKEMGALPVARSSAEVVRIENAIPRFGMDMDESNLAPETGIQSRAISYTKGCYIGQEVIARIRTYGQVAKALRLLRIESRQAPDRATKLFRDGKEVGAITSSCHSPRYDSPVALAYVRKEANSLGTKLLLPDGATAEIIVAP